MFFMDFLTDFWREVVWPSLSFDLAGTSVSLQDGYSNECAILPLCERSTMRELFF